MNVSVVIPTRGDVDLAPILQSLHGWEVVVWDNGAGRVTRYNNGSSNLRWYARVEADGVSDLSVYARYAAIEFARNNMILTQDDDVIVSDPRAIVHAWLIAASRSGMSQTTVVCNMPQEFRHSFYEEHALVGFGAVFHRDTPQRVFAKIGFDGKTAPFIDDDDWSDLTIRVGGVEVASFPDAAFVRRTCDIPVTALTETAFVDIPKENLPYAYGDDRMWRQPQHQAERSYMLEQVLKIKESE